MKTGLALALMLLLTGMLTPQPAVARQAVTPFVMQLTRSSDNHGHRRAFIQIEKVLDDIGEKNVKIEVVAYEDGILSLIANNKDTSQLLLKLAARGVKFKACRISMRAWDLKEADFPGAVEFIPAGAPEMIRLQMQGYKYWRP